MENQSKYIMIERNKFAALVKAHRKCLQMLSILTYAHTVMQSGNGFGRFTPSEGKGNPVKIRDSTRCCESTKTDIELLPLV